MKSYCIIIVDFWTTYPSETKTMPHKFDTSIDLDKILRYRLKLYLMNSAKVCHSWDAWGVSLAVKFYEILGKMQN